MNTLQDKELIAQLDKELEFIRLCLEAKRVINELAYLTRPNSWRRELLGDVFEVLDNIHRGK